MSSQKHEILFSRFGINYNELPARFKKGSVLVREEVRTIVSVQTGRLMLACQIPTETEGAAAAAPPISEELPEIASSDAPRRTSDKKVRTRTTIELHHCDIIGDEFWNARPNILTE